MFFVGSIETGERIAALRKIKGWSQSELGEKIGLTQASISEIERGTKRGSDDNEDFRALLLAIVDSIEIHRTHATINYKIPVKPSQI